MGLGQGLGPCVFLMCIYMYILWIGIYPPPCLRHVMACGCTKWDRVFHSGIPFWNLTSVRLPDGSDFRQDSWRKWEGWLCQPSLYRGVYSGNPENCTTPIRNWGLRAKSVKTPSPQSLPPWGFALPPNSPVGTKNPLKKYPSETLTKSFSKLCFVVL